MVIASKEPRARLDTVCALSKQLSSKFVMANFDAYFETSYNFKTTPVEGEKYFINVFAKIHHENGAEAELIPYVPIEIFVPKSMAMTSKLALGNSISFFILIYL